MAKKIRTDDLARFAAAFKISYERLHPEEADAATIDFEDRIATIATNYNKKVKAGEDVSLLDYIETVKTNDFVKNTFRVYDNIQEEYGYTGLYCHDLASESLKEVFEECEGIVGDLDIPEEYTLLVTHKLEVLACALYNTYGPTNVSYITIRKALFNDDKKGRNMLTYMENMKESRSLNRRQKRTVDTCISYFHNQYYNPNSPEYNSLWCNILRACIDNRTLKNFIVNYDELIDIIDPDSPGVVKL